MLQFNNRVAIVTGAGGGLGRAYALLLASRGASVVVNDLGGSRSGEGQSSRAADLVVKEIRESGGKAVANYDSVENGESVVSTALESYGRIDIVINNAGILRDRSFARISDADWELVHGVHLKGSFSVTRAAWPHMKKQKYGRIVMTSSVAGIYGNFGQANYSSAKLGLVGLCNTLAIEGESSGIKCNVIVPMATSRLTQDVFPPDMLETLKPEFIAPVVAWLCHEECQDTGSIIETAGGWAGKYRWQRARGALLTDSINSGVTLETIKERWSKVTDLEDGEHYSSNQEATMAFIEKLTPLSSNVTPKDSTTTVVGFVSDPFDYAYTPKDIILYSLGVGVSTTDDNGLDLLYEGSANFGALTSFGVIPAMGGLTGLVTGQVPGLDIDLSKVLHGEQYTELLCDKLPTNATLTSTFCIQSVLDKGSGGLYVLEIVSKNKQTGEQVLRNQTSIFVVGNGGFGGPRNSDSVVPTAQMPARDADCSSHYKTSIDQAALYRLSGDSNPLHIDPGFASLAGYDRPILHGLCTEGIAVRAITLAYANGDVSRIRAVKARFAKPVFPGQTIRTDMWVEEGRVLFECTVQETGKKCLTGGWVKIQGSLDNPVTKKSSLTSDAIFVEMGNRLKSSPEMVSSVGAVFRWVITVDKQPVCQWIVDLKNPPGKVYQEVLEESNTVNPDCIITVSDQDMTDMAKGILKPPIAFMQGKLKVKGNAMLLQKLQGLIGNDSAKL